MVNRISSMLCAAGLVLWAGAALSEGAADAMSVSGAYVRAIPPGQPNSASFLAITNRAAEAHALVDAESDAAEAVELHSHTMEDGMMKMRRIQRIDIPAGEAVALEPGGLHLMLIGLKQRLEPGQEVALTLVFEDGSRSRLTVPVRKIGTGTGEQDKGRKCGEGRCGSGRCGGAK